MKTCSRCGAEKPKSEYNRRVRSSDGLQSYCKTCTAEEGHRTFVKLKRKAFAAYGGPRCTNCGQDFFEVLTLDHINNDGAEHRKKVGSGHRVYYDLQRREWPEGHQVLCYDCNGLKQRHPNKLKEYANLRQQTWV